MNRRSFGNRVIGVALLLVGLAVNVPDPAPCRTSLVCATATVAQAPPGVTKIAA
jgi:hypothetical protein